MKLPIYEINTALKEADILLFKAPSFPRLGWWISKYTNSPYSHIGLVHFIDKEAYCIEFKEFIGCRIYKLSDYVKEDCGKIDVFRTVRAIYYYDMLHHFTSKTSQSITEDAKKFIGQKYGWYLIAMLIWVYIPIIRLFSKIHIVDIENPRTFVCSTFVSYLWRKHFIDPVSFLPDSYTKPSDVARSAIFKYIYTLSCEEQNGKLN